MRERERMETWIFCFFFSTSNRLSRSGTNRNLLRRFLTSETADLHLLWASKEGFLWSTSKSFNKFSISFQIYFSKQPNKNSSTSLAVTENLTPDEHRKQCSVSGQARGPYYCTHRDVFLKTQTYKPTQWQCLAYMVRGKGHHCKVGIGPPNESQDMCPPK